MLDSLEQLFDQKLIFTTGKGGVGKTSTSLGLALYASEVLQKNVLLVELNALNRVSKILNLPEKTDSIQSVNPNFQTINLSPKKCFEEYVLKHIRFQTLYKTFLDNKYVTNFLDAVPGLKEILMLGKIYELEKSNQNYDLMIVDLPASGHGLSLLEVPKVLMSVAKVGPLYKNAKAILQLLENPQKTALILVTLLEEMPVSETIEFVKLFQKNTKIIQTKYIPSKN